MPDIINPSLKTAMKGTLAVFFGMVFSILLWFAAKILIIRNVTKDDLGIYSLAVAVVGICSLIATLGLQEGIARYVPLYLGKGEKAGAQAVSRASINVSIISSLSIFILLYLLSGPISRYIFYKPELESPLKIMSFFIPFSVMTTVRTGILRGFNVMQAKVYADTGQPLFFLVILAAAFILHFRFLGVIWAYVFSMALVFIFISLYCFKKTELNPFSINSGGKSKELLKFSLPLLTVSLLGIVMNSTDTLMLGRYANAEDVGIYSVSMSLARLLTFPLSALGFVFMPLAGNMYSQGQMFELKRTYQVLTKWIFSATLPIFFILFFFPEMTLTFLFGNRFTVSAPSLRILLIGFLLYSFSGVNGLLMTVLGMSRELMHIYFFGTFLNVVLNYLLIKQFGFGIIGASVSTLTSLTALNGISLLMLYRRSRIHPFTPAYVRPVIGSILIGILIYAVAKSLPLHFWMMPLYFLAFIGGYIVSLRLTKSLDLEDVMLLNAILDKMGMNIGLIQKILGTPVSTLKTNNDKDVN